ncbi:FtsK/SpoIIIE domain-containing protein [Actinomycetospora aeridis]|uniref:FtsK/SpoIIIE domain-containing protein n=1 Tax=Actinomycetospora aeridis TaxID=3129231 RepID=A0ABU8N877_9PSEU
MSATLWRGQTIRRRADIQRTLIERDHGPFATALYGALWLLRWALWAALMGLWGLVYVPPVGAVVALLIVTGLVLGPWGVSVIAALAAGGAWAWARWSPGTWARYLVRRGERFWRRLRYRWVWDDVMAACGIKATDAAHRIVVPRLVWVGLGDHVDVLTVQLCPGVTLDTIAAQADGLRSEWAALDVRVTRHPRVRTWGLLRVVLHDTLAEQQHHARNRVDLTRLPIGRREDGEPWALRLLGRHLLVAGASGAGKGSIVTALLWALSPAIADGWVRVIGVDPKGGMEFGMYPELLHMFAWRSEAELVAALEHAAALTMARCESLQGRTRLHRPTIDDPFHIIVVDEIASLTSYIVDRALKERGRVALGTLLSKGRAAGFSVVGLVQDPRKEVLELRNLFTVKVGLRLDSRNEVAMVLGDSAHDRGARCEDIDLDTPGVAYVVDDEDRREPIKVRADFHDDAGMRWLATEYASPTHEGVPELVTKQRDTKRPDKRTDAS